MRPITLSGAINEFPSGSLRELTLDAVPTGILLRKDAAVIVATHGEDANLAKGIKL